MQQMWLPTVVVFASVSIALGIKQFAPVGSGLSAVLADEGVNLASFKEDCSNATNDTCYQATPDLSMCADMCSEHTACNSFAFCPGNEFFPTFPRCYLKTKKVDMMTIPHAEGTCSTYHNAGLLTLILNSTGMVARSEGQNLASFKEDCSEDPEPLDFCFKTNPTLATCKQACNKQDGCKSYVFCDDTGDVGFTRCYLKTADFNRLPHFIKPPNELFPRPGDCQSYYPTELGKCDDVKKHYKSQECCGMPSKELNPNKPMHF